MTTLSPSQEEQRRAKLQLNLQLRKATQMIFTDEFKLVSRGGQVL